MNNVQKKFNIVLAVSKLLLGGLNVLNVKINTFHNIFKNNMDVYAKFNMIFIYIVDTNQINFVPRWYLIVRVAIRNSIRIKFIVLIAQIKQKMISNHAIALCMAAILLSIYAIIMYASLAVVHSLTVNHVIGNSINFLF